jgi:creatinine amidohydrolase/Fe(II)-dependent formamide hydrolase-like protein
MSSKWIVGVASAVAVIGGACLLSASLSATRTQPAIADLDAVRPIDAANTVRMDEMTWMEVRDALRGGKDTVIVATGGIEPSGPYLVTGKHNVVLSATTQAIARALGNALVAPIVGFVPEGDIDPPSGWMNYPGTISVSDATFESLLVDICGSLRAHGFRNIILIGDHGGSQEGMQRVAERLTRKWKAGGTRVVYIPEYYNYDVVDRWLDQQGVRQVDEGLHDDFGVTAMMMAIDPTSVRANERIKAGKFRINGIDLAPMDKTIALGQKLLDLRVDITVKSIRAALEQPR